MITRTGFAVPRCRGTAAGRAYQCATDAGAASRPATGWKVSTAGIGGDAARPVEATIRRSPCSRPAAGHTPWPQLTLRPYREQYQAVWMAFAQRPVKRQKPTDQVRRTRPHETAPVG